jgi:hypothetical protein
LITAGDTATPTSLNGTTSKVAFAVLLFGSVPVIVAVPEVVTSVVVIVNVAFLLPAATVTFAGTCANVSLLASVINNPPVGASEFNSTIPVAVPPPTTLAASSPKLRISTTIGAVIFSSAIAWRPLASVARITALLVLVTADVVMLNVAVLVPAGTVTELGTWASAKLLKTVIASPPVGAAPDKVRVAVEGLPPTTLSGLNAIFSKNEGTTLNDSDSVLLFGSVPVMVAELLAVTADVVIVKVALRLPDATVTEAGTCAKV